MFLGRAGLALAGESVEGRDDVWTSLAGLDDLVYIAALCCHVRSSEVLHILCSLGFLVRVLAEDDVGCTGRTHDRNLGSRPGHDLVSAQLAAAHGYVGTAISLAGDDGDLGHRSLAVCVEHLGAVTDDAVVFLVYARQEARHINQIHQREVEGIAEADETCCLIGSVHIQAASHDIGLVGDDTYAAAVETGKASDDIGSKVLMHFVELAVIDNTADNILHIVRSIRIVRHYAVQGLILTIRVIAGINNRSILHVVAGQEGQEVTNLLYAVVLVLCGKVSHTAAAVMGHGAAQSLCGDFLSRDGLDNRRAGDEHLAGVLHHVDEVRDGRAVHSAACAGSHDDGNLGNDTGSSGVAEEDAAIAGQSIYCLLDAGTAGIVDADAGSSHLHGQIHDLPDLMGMLLTKGAALDGEVLGISIDQAAVHLP